MIKFQDNFGILFPQKYLNLKKKEREHKKEKVISVKLIKINQILKSKKQVKPLTLNLIWLQIALTNLKIYINSSAQKINK